MTTATFNIRKRHTWEGPLSDRAAKVCRMFGLTLDRLSDESPTHECYLEIRPGDVVYITGASGSGKTVLFQALEEMVPAENAVNLDCFDLPDDRTVIDCLDSDFMTSIKTLCAVGLSSVFAMLNRPCYLSDGQKYRFRLALAMASGKPFIFADEFCCELDRITAGTVAYNLHQFAKRTETTVILASSREDILIDLAPDVVVVKDFCDRARVTYKYRR